MDDELEERKQHTNFQEYPDFSHTQEGLLKANIYAEPSPDEEKEEYTQYRKLTNTLLSYQEQSYLLDPYLERLVTPVVERLKSHAKEVAADHTLRPSHARMERLAMLLYGYIKFRGYKAIIRFFPHEVADLGIAVGYMQLPKGIVHEPSQWALRYVVLLWLSLICMIPFDLEQFDDDEKGKTAKVIEDIAKGYLGKAGLEREGAAILLSRLYMRQDTTSQFNAFLDWGKITILNTMDAITATGILQVVAETLKSGPATTVKTSVSSYWSLSAELDTHSNLLSNTIVRKYKTKISSRVGLRLLPGNARSRLRGRNLNGDNTTQMSSDDDDIDVPEEEETILEQLFNALQDRDTVVRWSAAKGVARISERLPYDFAQQVLDTLLGLFSIHTVAAATLYDIPPIAEATWHGACLACAEMARRGLISSSRLPELIQWLSKALYFDIRKGAHSVGSNVRDASAYVLWALARSQDPSDLKPHADALARHLVTVSIYDREVHIRRAASAAFQEFVGRTSLFPHGIDVLGKTDFYSVGIRRNSFLVAAPQVSQHEEYATILFDHLLNVTLRHWDFTMRSLGSQSLRLICLHDLTKFGPEGTARATKLMDSADISDMHGGLLALAEIAKAYETAGVQDIEAQKRNIFRLLNRVPEKTLLGSRNEIVTSAACKVIESSITPTEINLGAKSSVPGWRKILDHGLKHRDVAVQEAASSAMGVVSGLVDCSATVSRLIPELKRGSFMAQQSLGRFLGAIDYEKFPSCLETAINTLLNCVDRTSGPFRSNVEARRNCYQAMAQLFQNVAPRLSSLMDPVVVNTIFDALLEGLSDYSVDERGDVGSWVRMACIRGLDTFIEVILSHAGDLPALEEYLPLTKYHSAIGGILKQGVERLDNVRAEAGRAFENLLHMPCDDQKGRWRPHNATFLAELLLRREGHSSGWNDASWLFPQAVQILRLEPYRKPVLLGLISSIGSLTDSTHRPAAASLVSFVRSLPVEHAKPGGDYDIAIFVGDILDYAKSNLTSNAVMIPVLQVFNVLLEGDAFGTASSSEKVIDLLRSFLSLVCRHIARLKSVRRVHESIKVAVNLLIFDQLSEECLGFIPQFLAHQYPTVRASAAEYMYLALQRMDLGRETDEAEEIILETEWSSLDANGAEEAANAVVERLKNASS